MASFICRYAEQVLTITPASRGQVDGVTVTRPGHRIEFRDGKYETTVPKEAAFIRGHPQFGVTIFEDMPVGRGREQVEETADDEAPTLVSRRGRRAAE